MLAEEPGTANPLLRFALVGIMSTALYASLAWALTAKAGMPASLSSLAAYASAALLSYAGHRRFTFPSDRSAWQTAPRFAGLSLAGYAVALLAPLLMTDMAGLPTPWSIAVTCILVPVLSYAGMSRFVFGAASPGSWWLGGLRNSAADVVAAGILVAAAVLQFLMPAVTDVSWLLEVGEQVLAGQTLYVDIWETNPPASVLLYLPAVAAAQLIPVPAEMLVIVGTLAAIAVSVGFCERLLDRAGLLHDRESFRVLALCLLAVLPLGTFAQREHIALLTVLPLLCLAAMRAEAVKVERWIAVVSGLGGGVAMAIKPHFALAILLPYLFCAWRTGWIRALWRAEIWTATSVVLVYLAAIMIWWPEYRTEILPVIADTYRAARYPLVTMLGWWLLLLYGCLALIALSAMREARFPSVPVCLALASLGFAAAAVEQGKAWPYHLLPGVVLIGIVALLQLAANRKAAAVSVVKRSDRIGQAVLMSMAVTILALSAIWFAYRSTDPVPLAAAVEKAGPPNPRVIAIGSDLAVGHPLTRMVGGTWVGTVASQWISKTAMLRIKRSPDDELLAGRMRDWIASDRAFLAGDIRAERPDVLVFDRRGYDWLAWAQADAATAALLSEYRRAAVVDEIEIWTR